MLTDSWWEVDFVPAGRRRSITMQTCRRFADDVRLAAIFRLPLYFTQGMLNLASEYVSYRYPGRFSKLQTVPPHAMGPVCPPPPPPHFLPSLVASSCLNLGRECSTL